MSGELQLAGPVPDGEGAIGGNDLTIAASGERAGDALDGSASHPSAGSGRARDAVPTTIGRFQIERTLGSGGMGVVYLAEDPSLGRKVAIKLLHADRAQHEHSKARLQREARALASLSHPNVVVVHEVGVHDHQVYLVMEYVAGQTLRAWTRAHAGDWAAIVAQYRAAGEGLAAAHRAGIIHRDFKPDNVIVDEDGRPHVLDFGLASPGVVPGSSHGSYGAYGSYGAWDELTEVDLTKTGTILGTPAYMAPEQFLGANLDARSDQFSLCVALWEALFDRRPFGGADLVELRSRVLQGKRGEPPMRTRVPRWIRDALARGLAIDPDQRFASMPELLRALADPRPSRRRRVWMGVAIGSLGALSLAVLLLRPPTDASPSSAAPEIVAGEPSPPISVEPAADWPSVSIWPLTRTSGYGVIGATVAVGGDMAYAVHRGESGELEWWWLSASSAEPRPIDLPLSGRATVHQAPGGIWWIVDEDAIRAVLPGSVRGRTFELRDEPEDVLGGRLSYLAPDGRSLALTRKAGFEIWDLGGARVEPVRVELGTAPWGLGWSPDSRRIAASTATATHGAHRIDVFDADGSLRSSTPWPESAGGMLLSGLAWLPEGLVTLVFDGDQVWVQCVTPTESGLRLERRSTSVPLSRHTRVMGSRAEHTLVLLSPEDEAHVLVLERLADGARPVGPTPIVRAGKGTPTWLSDTELAYLAAEPPGALVRLDLDDPAHLDVLTAGSFEWAASDGAGGLVLGSTGDPPIQHWPKGAASPQPLRLPGVGSLSPNLSCREPHDCLMMISRDRDDAFFAVDLEQDRVRRSFQCPLGVECREGRWSRSRDGEQLWVVDAERHELVRLDARSGARIGKEMRAPPWALVQSVTEAERGELLVTGMLRGEPPWGSPSNIYLLMGIDDDGSFRRLWSDERTWVVRPRVSPSGRHIAVEGITFHSELFALGLGSLCDSPAPGGPAD